MTSLSVLWVAFILAIIPLCFSDQNGNGIDIGNRLIGNFKAGGGGGGGGGGNGTEGGGGGGGGGIEIDSPLNVFGVSVGGGGGGGGTEGGGGGGGGIQAHFLGIDIPFPGNENSRGSIFGNKKRLKTHKKTKPVEETE